MAWHGEVFYEHFEWSEEHPDPAPSGGGSVSGGCLMARPLAGRLLRPTCRWHSRLHRCLAIATAIAIATEPRARLSSDCPHGVDQCYFQITFVLYQTLVKGISRIRASKRYLLYKFAKLYWQCHWRPLYCRLWAHISHTEWWRSSHLQTSPYSFPDRDGKRGSLALIL